MTKQINLIQKIISPEAPKAVDAPPKNEQLVIDLARELYERFVMGGWEPQEAYPTIRAMLAHEVDARSVNQEAQRDYEDMRRFQSKFIECDHARRETLEALKKIMGCTVCVNFVADDPDTPCLLARCMHCFARAAISKAESEPARPKID